MVKGKFAQPSKSLKILWTWLWVIRLEKTSSRRFDQDEYIFLSHTSSRCLQDIFQTSSRLLQDVFPRRLQGVLKKRLQDIFKTSSRRPQHEFKIYHQVKLFLLTRLQDVFKAFSRRIQDVFETYCEDNYLQKDLSRPHFWEMYGHVTKCPRETLQWSIFAKKSSFADVLLSWKYASLLRKYLRWILMRKKTWLVPLHHFDQNFRRNFWMKKLA